jgi:uncharacterized BrkB/YihY/UPF0761 family membrane protein
VFAAAAFRPARTSAELIRALNDFGFLLAVPVALVATAFFAAIARLLFKTASLPVWLSWLAVLAAIGSGLAIGGVFKDTGAFNAGNGALGFYVPFISFLAWILLVSIVLAAGAAMREIVMEIEAEWTQKLGPRRFAQLRDPRAARREHARRATVPDG